MCNAPCIWDIAVVYATLWYPCVSDSHFLTYFSWESLPGHSNWTMESRILQPGVIKLCIQLSDTAPISTQSNPVCRIRLCNRTCRIMLVHLHVFHFLSHSDSHNACIESWLKVLWFLHFANLVKGPFFSSTIWKLGLPMVQLAIDSTSLDIYIYICTHTHRHAYKQRC